MFDAIPAESFYRKLRRGANNGNNGNNGTATASSVICATDRAPAWWKNELGDYITLSYTGDD